MQTKSTVVKMQEGLPACHCCQEKFLTSLKSQLLGNKNKFTYFQIERCPVSVDLLAEPVISVDVYCTDSRFLIWFAFWFYFFWGTVHVCFICLLSEMRGPFISFLCFCVNLCRPNWVFSPLTSMFHHSLEIHALYIYKRQTRTIPQKHHVCWRKSHLIQSQISIWTPRWLILSLGVIF